MTKVKICGLTRPQDIRAVNEARPDYVGFVFAPSPRMVTDEQALQLCQGLSGDICLVGVFVNECLERIMNLVEDSIIDVVQLHGRESKKYVSILREFIDVPIIKSMSVKNSRRMGYTKGFKCDYIMLDTYDPCIFGGTGKTFNWDLIPKMSKPFFLAGGIDITNLREAMSTGAYCIDVSSGLETAGHKDRNKIIDFMNAAREINKC